MTVSLKHKFSSSKSDSADTSLIRPSNWNDEHDLTLATDRLLGRDTTGTGTAEEISVAGGIEFTGTGGIQRSALTGDITAAAGSNTTTIANDAVTYAKIQNVSTNNKILGRSTAGAGDIEELSVGTGLTLSSGTLSVTTNTYQPLDADLTAIAALAGTSGILTKTAANTWSLDTTSYSATGHTHSIANVTNLQASLDGKAASSHTHTIANVTGLQTALDGKQAVGSYAASAHTHVIGDVTGLQSALDGKQAAGSYAVTSGPNTFNGSQTFSTTGFIGLYLSGGAGSGKYTVYQTSGVNRWTVGLNNNNETGSNAGSSYEINRYSDAGAWLSTAFDIRRSDGQVSAQGVYDLTTSNAVNVNVGSGGAIRRSTSSIKYKKDVEDLDHSLSDNAIQNLRPVWYRSKNPVGDDKAEWSHIGLIAEEVVQIEPRLVSFRTERVTYDDDGNRSTVALENPEPEGVDYARLSVLLLDVVQRQTQTIASLAARVEALEANAPA